MRHLTTIFAIAFIQTLSVAGDLPPSSDELLASMRAGNLKLLKAEQSLTNYQCKFTSSLKSFDSKADKTNIKESTKFFQVYKKDGRLLLHFEKTLSNPKSRENTDEIIGSLNTDEMFMISRRDQKADWALVNYSNKDFKNDFWSTFAGLELVLHPLVALNQNLLLKNHLDNPTFRFGSIQNRPDGRIEAEYSVEWENEPKKDVQFSQKGTIVLDPKFNYAVLELSCIHTLQRSGSKALTKPIIYKRILDESGTCKALQYQYGKDAKLGVQNISVEFTDKSSEPIPEGVFSLKYYRVPQPGDIDAQPIPFYLTTSFWIYTCSGCILLSILFAWFAKRQRSSH